MKKGLILEGGAMRGMFTSGVLDVLMENEIRFDGAVGVSAGAAFGCNYKSGQIGRAIRYNMRFCHDSRYCGIRSLLKTGCFYNTDFCYREVPLHYDPFDFAAYSENPMQFFVVCTDIETGLPFYREYTGFEDHGFDWIRASASMPLVSLPVEIDGKLYLDGGISDSIPLKFFEQIGYDRNVVILTRPEDYRKKKNALIPLIRAKYKAFPQFVKMMETRHERYNETLSYLSCLEKQNKIFVIRPSEPLPLSRTEKNPKKIKAVYEIGREIASKRLQELKCFLET